MIGRDGNKLFSNTSTTNEDDGFDVSGDNNKLKKNTATDNIDDGIDVNVGDTNNKIIKNTATGNDDFDLADDNLACDANKWKKNTFVTKSQDCIGVSE